MANVFELKSDLGAFIHLPHSHTGKRLGQAVYRAFMRVKSEHKVCTAVVISSLAHIHHFHTSDGVDDMRQCE